MQSLFSAAGRRRLDEIVRPGLLCAFDFDGTLAPIVPHPDHAYLPEETRALLLRLAELAPVAIITGRAVDDIANRLGFEPDFLIGNHGLEGVPGWEAEAARHEEYSRQWRAALERAIAERRFDEGIFVEDKRYSLSIHYRETENHEEIERQLEEFFTSLQPPPRVVAGKAIYSLMPEGAGHKGSALEQLMRQTGARSAIYVGDDVTDEDVFRLQRPDVLAVRIDEAPDSAAEFVLHGTAEIRLLLLELIERLQAAGVAGRRKPAVHSQP
jgi:trehalose 6-phosphate phosphatase